jgi:hypothetical protein
MKSVLITKLGWNNVKHTTDRDALEALEIVHLGRGDNVRVKRGEQSERTNYISVVTAKVGEINGKDVLSLITAFPGKNAAHIARRSDFEKEGYYMVMP